MLRPLLLGIAIASTLVGAAHDALAQAQSPYAQWTNGPSADPDNFPIAVWLQHPKNAVKYKAAGINLYVGLWKGPTEAQLTALKAAGMPVICDQNAVGLAHVGDRTIIGWLQPDEPDNAQLVRLDPATQQRIYGGPVPPARVVADYERLRAADPSRPVLLNLGQGVANDEWKGRGRGAHVDDYLTYVHGGDIVSFDVYPVAGLRKPDGENYLWYVAKGVDRLMQWTDGRRPIWNCIECTHISNEQAKATPHQVRAEVWMGLVHGSRGIIYFVHEFKPRFNEDALLDDPEMLTAVTAINRQIGRLAPVLNQPTIRDAASVKSAPEEGRIDVMVKRHGGSTYLFAVGMRNEATRGVFSVKGLPRGARAEVIGEGRVLEVEEGRFSDQFAPYDVHLYRIR